MLNNHATEPIEELFLEDPQKLALLSLKPGIEITYKPLPTGRICGVVHGNRAVIEQVFSDLSNNQPIGSRDILEAIRKTRTAIFSAKSQLIKTEMPR